MALSEDIINRIRKDTQAKKAGSLPAFQSLEDRIAYDVEQKRLRQEEAGWNTVQPKEQSDPVAPKLTTPQLQGFTPAVEAYQNRQTYYSRPDFERMTAREEQELKAVEARYRQTRQALRILGDRKGPESYRTQMQQDADEAERNYRAAGKALQEAKGKKAQEYQKWYQSIRKTPVIDRDIQKIDQQIRDQEWKDSQDLRQSGALAALGFQDGAVGRNPMKQTTSPALQDLRQKKALLEEEKSWAEFYKWASVMQNEDFEEKSRFQPKPNTSRDNTEYNLVNRDPATMKEAGSLSGDGTPTTGTNTASTRYVWDNGFKKLESSAEMNAQEIAIYNYLWQQSPKKASDYLHYLQNDLHFRQRLADEAAAAQYAEQHPVIASAVRIGSGPLRGAAYVGQAIDYMADGEIDQNALYNRPNQMGTAMQNAVAKKIEKSGKWGAAGSFAYNLGMSMADFLTNTAITGGNSNMTLALMGTGAAADATIAAKDRGLSDDQAFTLGTIAGAAEIITEKVSLDTLLDANLLSDSFGRYLLKNVIAEGSEEGASDLINLAADLIISKDQSEWNKAIEAYMATGKNRKDATEQALVDQAMEVGLDVLGGAISGGLMGGGFAMGNAIHTGQVGSALKNSGVEQNVLLENMSKFAEVFESEAGQKIAEELGEKLDNGEKITARDLGRLAMANHQAKEEKQAEIEKAAREPQSFGDAIMAQLTGKNQADTGVAEMNANKETYVTTEDGIRVSQELHDQADRISKATGRNIRFFEEAGDGTTIKNGFFSGGEIYINTRSQNPMGQIVGHELTHSLQDTEAYSELSRMVQQSMGDQLEQKKDELRSLYREAGIELDETKGDLEHELVAEYIESHLLENENDIRKLVQEKPTVGQKIVGWIDKVLAKLGNDGARERNYLRKVRATYARALRESQRTAAPQTERQVETNKATENVAQRATETVTEEQESREKADREAAAAADQEAKAQAEREKKAEADRKAKAEEKRKAQEEREAREEQPGFRERRQEYKRTKDMSQEQRDAEENQALLKKNQGRLKELDQMTELYDEMLDNNQIEREEYDAVMDAIDAERQKLGMDRQYSVSAVKEAEKPMPPAMEQQFSITYNQAYMDAAREMNEENEFVSTEVMDQAEKDRAEVAERLQAIHNKPKEEQKGMPADIEGNTFISDASYGGTEENTTECVRSLAADAFIDALAEDFGRPLTVEEQLTASQFLASGDAGDYAQRTECPYCYVATDRKAYRAFLGEYIKQRDGVLDKLRKGNADTERYSDRYKDFLKEQGLEAGPDALKEFKEKVGKKANPYGKVYGEFLKKRKDTDNMWNRFHGWVELYENGDDMINAGDLTTFNRLMGDPMQQATETEEDLKARLARYPKIQNQLKDAMTYAQAASWAKKRMKFLAYNGHILTWKQGRIDELNSHYGLRMYSFSDYSPAFLLENMQMVTDAAVRGLKILAYTKEMEFAKIFAPTGMNINISTFGTMIGDNVAENNIVGANWAEARALRKKYDNVGITFVATSDKIVKWALEQDWIDVVIPYHLVRTGKEVAKRMGYTNFTKESSDKKVKPGWNGEDGDLSYIPPTVHQNDLGLYKAALEANHLKARFERWMDNPNYMKLVNETRLSAGESNVVQPKFDMTAARESLARLETQGYYQPIGGSVDEMYKKASQLGDKMRTAEAYPGLERFLKGKKAVSLDDLQEFIDKSREKEAKKSGKQFSVSRAEPAPVFYSQMERVVEGMNQKKFGAASVVSMLRGRGVKVEEIKWSGIEQWLQGKKSVTKDELLEFIKNSSLSIDVKELRIDPLREWTKNDAVTFINKENEITVYSGDEEACYFHPIDETDEDGNRLWVNEYEPAGFNFYTGEEEPNTYTREEALEEAKEIADGQQDYWDSEEERQNRENGENSEVHWSQYSVKGGKNYKEILFKLPGSDYSTGSMDVHWSESGVLAHARVQDIGRNMLFVEEIQSDWHNEGHKEGYESEGGKVPDAPFRDTYQEFVMKALLRMAAENGYESIGWTTGKMQEERWSDDFAEGYRIEYDQQIPKFMRKYCKQWGATVEEDVLDTENGDAIWKVDITPAMRDSVMYEGQPQYSVSRAEPSRRELVGWIDSAYYDGVITEEEHDRYQAKLEQTPDNKLQYYKFPAAVEDYRQAENQKAEQAIREQELAREDQQRRDAMTPEQKDREQQETLHVSRDQLSNKQDRYLKSAEARLLKEMKRELGLDKFEDRQEMKDAITEIADAYLDSGIVPEEKLDEMWEKVYTTGIQYDRQYYDEHEEARTYMRTTPITLSARDQADIADYGDFRKRTRHLLRIVNEGGFPVDKAYADLHEIDPALFPENITHPADQLVRMYDEADKIRIVEGHLSDYDGEDKQFFEQAMRESYNRAFDHAMSDFRNVRRSVQEQETRQQKQEALIPETAEEIMEVYEQLKQARREKDRVVGRNLLTADDDKLVGDLLRGKIGLENLNPEHDNVKGITEVYEAKREYEKYARIIHAYKAKIHRDMRDQADSYLETAINWKDKKSGFQYARETMRRNIYDIVPDKELADQILQEYFEPVQIQEAKATKFRNEMRDRVRALNLSREVQEGNVVSEAHAVQLYGEAMDNIAYLEKLRGLPVTRDGKSLRDWDGVVQNLWAENPNLDPVKIKNAVQEFRKIYEELFQKMNLVRIQNGYEPVNHRRGYFPHFQPDAEDGVLAAFGRALGINTAVDNLPTTINGLTHTFRPGITWFGNAQERLGYNTAYDAVEGFDRYIEGVANVIFQTKNIQKLRALATQIRYRTSDAGIQEQVDAINEDPDLTEEMKKLKIEELYKEGKFVLSNFINDLEEYTNLLAGKKSKMDRNIEALVGRRFYSMMKAWENRVGANMIAGNIASAMTNFIPLTQAWSRISSKNMLQAMWDTIANIKESDGLMGTSDFYINRMGSDPLVQTKAQKASAALGTPMELIDSFVTESIVRAAYQENLDAGLSEAEAMHQADLFAAGVMADRSRGSMPTLFASRNPLIKAMTQFQLEVNNQWSEMLKDLPRALRDRGAKFLAMALLKYFLGAWLYNQLFEKLFGRKPAIDPLSMLNDRAGDLTGYKLPNILDIATGNGEYQVERVHAGKALGNAADDVIGELPFTAALGMLGLGGDGGRLPVASSVPNLLKLGDATFDPEMNWRKRVDTYIKEGSKLMYVIPPFGGAQAMKTIKGIKAFLQGGSYTINKEGEKQLQYPIYNDSFGDAVGNAIISAIMGKNATGEARRWADNGFKSLNPKQTELYQGLLKLGMKDRKAYEYVKGLADLKQTDEESLQQIQREYLQTTKVPDAARGIAYYQILATKEEQELMDTMTDAGTDPGAVADVLMAFKDADALPGGNKATAKREALLKAPLTEEEKLEIYRNKLLDDPTSRDADIDAFRQAGMDFGTYLTMQNKYAEINAKDLKARDKSMEFAQWVQKQDLNQNQKTLVKDTFAYYSMVPAKAEKYEKFLGMGIPDDKAYDLAEAIENLPEDAKPTDRYEVIAESNLTEAQQMQAMQASMPETEYGKLEKANAHGISPKEYVTFKKAIVQYDADGNGSYNQKEVEAALNAMGTGSVLGSLMGVGRLSNSEKAVLWQMANRSWKPNKNPFDTTVGERVYYELNPDKRP